MATGDPPGAHTNTRAGSGPYRAALGHQPDPTSAPRPVCIAGLPTADPVAAAAGVVGEAYVYEVGGTRFALAEGARGWLVATIRGGRLLECRWFGDPVTAERVFMHTAAANVLARGNYLLHVVIGGMRLALVPDGPCWHLAEQHVDGPAHGPAHGPALAVRFNTALRARQAWLDRAEELLRSQVNTAFPRQRPPVRPARAVSPQRMGDHDGFR